MRANSTPITALIAALVVLASLGPALAAGSAGTPTSVEPTNDDLDTDASTASAVEVHVYPQDDQLVLDASYEGDGTALVTVETLDGSYAGEGTYEIDGDERVVLPYPDEPTTLKITVETDGYEGSFVVDFEREIVACSGEEVTVLRPIVVDGSTSVDAKSSMADTSLESSTVLRANASHPDLPVECRADETLNGTDANVTVEGDHDGSDENADDGSNEATEEARDGAENGQENARSGVEHASSFVAQVFADVTHFGQTVVSDLRGDGEAVSDAAREDANDVGEQVSANASADANASASGDATVDEDGASASGQADANASAEADAGSANANAGIVAQIRALIGAVVG